MPAKSITGTGSFTVTVPVKDPSSVEPSFWLAARLLKLEKEPTPFVAIWIDAWPVQGCLQSILLKSGKVEALSAAQQHVRNLLGPAASTSFRNLSVLPSPQICPSSQRTAQALKF